jgi:hypothetical protein
MLFSTLYIQRLKTMELRAVKKRKLKKFKKVLVSIGQLFILLRYNVFYFFNFFIIRKYKTYLKHRIFRFFYVFNIFFVDFSFLIFFDFLRFFVFYRMYSRYNQILISHFFDCGDFDGLVFYYHDVFYRASLIMSRGFVFKGSENVFQKVSLLRVPFKLVVSSLLIENFIFLFSLFGFVFYSKGFFNRLERFYVRIM